MGRKNNRRELMLDEAATLFKKHGYLATTTRQIADAVGCTDAALYYHFKDGKRALLRAVLERDLPNLGDVIELSRQAKSLPDVLRVFLETLIPHGKEVSWLLKEMEFFSLEERQLVFDVMGQLHTSLAEVLKPFLPPNTSQTELENAAWLIACTGVGYREIFLSAGIDQVVPFSIDDLARSFALIIGFRHLH